MPYMHKAKWGAVDALAKKTLVIDPHMFSAPVGTIRVGDKGERELMFWRTKTRCSTSAEWMELHDATDGSCLWRAEARYSDRAAPVTSVDANGRERTEFLTVVRLYLESETMPRLMIVHRDTQPNGLKSANCAKSLAVYMLDPSQQHKSPTTIGGDNQLNAVAAGGGPMGGGVATPMDAALKAAGVKAPSDDVEQFDFAALPAGEDIFQMTLNGPMTTLSLAALRLPTAEEMEERLAKGRGLRMAKSDVRTLARYKITDSMLKRKVEIDGGLDLPLVCMLLCSVDQLMLAHQAIDYDVEWPEDYGWSQLECLSQRKREADKLKFMSEFGMQTGGSGERTPVDTRSCFCF